MSSVNNRHGNWLHRSKLAHSLSTRSRQRKLQLLLSEIGDDPWKKILDVGAGGESEYCENTLEKYYPYQERIVAVSMEECIHSLASKYPSVRWVQANGLHLPFGDRVFDLAVANAVIEHITGFENRIQFVSELLRVARSCFVTTPNAAFPIEPHSRLPIVHWLPDSWHNFITDKVGIGFISKGPAGYFDPLTVAQFRAIFPRDSSVRIRYGWLGMTLIAICDQ